MKLNPDFRIQAEISINDKEAEFLELLTSYSLIKWFIEHASKKYTEEQYNTMMSNFRKQLHKILEAKEKALEAIKEFQ